MTALDVTTAAGCLTERQDYLYVYVADSPGNGWDVVVRVDGTYPDRADAEGAAVHIRERLDSLTDVGRSKRHWWNGPPWLRGAPR